jgi:hypothetical protein
LSNSKKEMDHSALYNQYSVKDDPDSLQNVHTDFLKLYEKEKNGLTIDAVVDANSVGRHTERDRLYDALERILKENPTHVQKVLGVENNPYKVIKKKFEKIDDHVYDSYYDHTGTNRVFSEPMVLYTLEDFDLYGEDSYELQVYIKGEKASEGKDYQYFNNLGACRVYIRKSLLSDSCVVEFLVNTIYKNYDENGNAKYFNHSFDIGNINADGNYVFEMRRESIGRRLSNVSDVSVFYRYKDYPYFRPVRVGGFKVEENGDNVLRVTVKDIYKFKGEIGEVLVGNKNTHVVRKFTTPISYPELNDYFLSNDFLPLFDRTADNVPVIPFNRTEEIEVYFGRRKMARNYDYRVVWNEYNPNIPPVILFTGRLHGNKELEIRIAHTPYNDSVSDYIVGSSVDKSGVVKIDDFRVPMSNEYLDVRLNGLKIPNKNIERVDNSIIKINHVKDIEKTRRIEISALLRNSDRNKELVQKLKEYKEPVTDVIETVGIRAFMDSVKGRENLEEIEVGEFPFFEHEKVELEGHRIPFAFVDGDQNRPLFYDDEDPEKKIFYVKMNERKYMSKLSNKLTRSKMYFGYDGNQLGVNYFGSGMGEAINLFYQNKDEFVAFYHDELGKDRLLISPDGESSSQLFYYDDDGEKVFLEYFNSKIERKPITANYIKAINRSYCFDCNGRLISVYSTEGHNRYSVFAGREGHRGRLFMRDEDGSLYPVYYNSDEFNNSIFHTVGGRKVPIMYTKDSTLPLYIVPELNYREYLTKDEIRDFVILFEDGESIENPGSIGTHKIFPDERIIPTDGINFVDSEIVFFDEYINRDKRLVIDSNKWTSDYILASFVVNANVPLRFSEHDIHMDSNPTYEELYHIEEVLLDALKNNLRIVNANNYNLTSIPIKVDANDEFITQCDDLLADSNMNHRELRAYYRRFFAKFVDADTNANMDSNQKNIMFPGFALDANSTVAEDIKRPEELIIDANSMFNK